MRRREFIAGLCGVVAWSHFSAAQPAERVYRLGVLTPGSSAYEALRGQLAKLGFVEGGNLVIDLRVGAPDELPKLARDLVATQPDAIMAVSAALAAMKGASSAVPVIA